MKGLDTPVLLGLLHCSRPTAELLRTLEGEELVTTELNLAELTTIVGRGGPRRRKEHLPALERLRRRLTVLPVDRKAIELLGLRAPQIRTAAELHTGLLMATFEAAGCAQVLTASGSRLGGTPWKVKIANVAVTYT